MTARRPTSPPPIAQRQLRLFQAYLSFYFKRNFHTLLVLQLADLSALEQWPLLVCMNHPSWWDPILALYVSGHFFPKRAHYGPIEQGGVSKYKFFERLGFFPIDKKSRSGAVRFLDIGESVLSSPKFALWVNPQGYFTDVRQRPVTIEPGVGHLAHRIGKFAMLPVTFEYTFWKERYPEAFVCLGTPMLVENGRERKPSEWNQLFSGALESTQDCLAERVQRQDASLFQPLLTGASGVGGMYDLWRAFKSRLQGKPWQPEHGSR